MRVRQILLALSILFAAISTTYGQRVREIRVEDLAPQSFGDLQLRASTTPSRIEHDGLARISNTACQYNGPRGKYSHNVGIEAAWCENAVAGSGSPQRALENPRCNQHVQVKSYLSPTRQAVVSVWINKRSANGIPITHAQVEDLALAILGRLESRARPWPEVYRRAQLPVTIGRYSLKYWSHQRKEISETFSYSQLYVAFERPYDGESLNSYDIKVVWYGPQDPKPYTQGDLSAAGLAAGFSIGKAEITHAHSAKLIASGHYDKNAKELVLKGRLSQTERDALDTLSQQLINRLAPLAVDRPEPAVAAKPMPPRSPAPASGGPSNRPIDRQQSADTSSPDHSQLPTDSDRGNTDDSDLSRSDSDRFGTEQSDDDNGEMTDEERRTREAAAVSAILVALILAGTAAGLNLTQAIAMAITDAVRAGLEVTADNVIDALLDLPEQPDGSTDFVTPADIVPATIVPDDPVPGDQKDSPSNEPVLAQIVEPNSHDEDSQSPPPVNVPTLSASHVDQTRFQRTASVIDHLLQNEKGRTPTETQALLDQIRDTVRSQGHATWDDQDDLNDILERMLAREKIVSKLPSYAPITVTVPVFGKVELGTVPTIGNQLGLLGTYLGIGMASGGIAGRGMEALGASTKVVGGVSGMSASGLVTLVQETNQLGRQINKEGDRRGLQHVVGHTLIGAGFGLLGGVAGAVPGDGASRATKVAWDGFTGFVAGAGESMAHDKVDGKEVSPGKATMSGILGGATQAGGRLVSTRGGGTGSPAQSPRSGAVDDAIDLPTTPGRQTTTPMDLESPSPHPGGTKTSGLAGKPASGDVDLPPGSSVERGSASSQTKSPTRGGTTDADASPRQTTRPTTQRPAVKQPIEAQPASTPRERATQHDMEHGRAKQQLDAARKAEADAAARAAANPNDTEAEMDLREASSRARAAEDDEVSARLRARESHDALRGDRPDRVPEGGPTPRERATQHDMEHGRTQQQLDAARQAESDAAARAAANPGDQQAAIDLREASSRARAAEADEISARLRARESHDALRGDRPDRVPTAGPTSQKSATPPPTHPTAETKPPVAAKPAGTAEPQSDGVMPAPTDGKNAPPSSRTQSDPDNPPMNLRQRPQPRSDADELDTAPGSEPKQTDAPTAQPPADPSPSPAAKGPYETMDDAKVQQLRDRAEKLDKQADQLSEALDAQEATANPDQSKIAAARERLAAARRSADRQRKKAAILEGELLGDPTTTEFGGRVTYTTDTEMAGPPNPFANRIVGTLPKQVEQVNPNECLPKTIQRFLGDETEEGAQKILESAVPFRRQRNLSLTAEEREIHNLAGDIGSMPVSNVQAFAETQGVIATPISPGGRFTAVDGHLESGGKVTLGVWFPNSKTQHAVLVEGFDSVTGRYTIADPAVGVYEATAEELGRYAQWGSTFLLSKM